MQPSSKRQRLAPPNKPFRSPVKHNNSPSEGDSPATEQGKSSDTTSNSPCTSTAPSTLSLSKRIRTLRNEIDTLTQAISLLTTPRNEELEASTQKWRRTSQLAAEEVYGFMKEKVDSLGGLRAMQREEKEALKRKREWQMEEFAAERLRKGEEGCVDLHDGDGANGDGNYYVLSEERSKEDTASRKTELGGTCSVDREELEEDDQDNEFTMDKMLQKLNVDMGLIGYDRQEQDWIR